MKHTHKNTRFEVNKKKTANLETMNPFSFERGFFIKPDSSCFLN